MATTPITPFSEPLSYYQSLVTSEYRNSVNMLAWLNANLQLFQDVSACLDAMLNAFDLDTAVGVQLDVLGAIIGASRIVPFQPSDSFTTNFYDIPALHVGVVCDGTNMWVTDNFVSGNVTQFDRNGNILNSFGVGTSPHDLAFDGSNIWVTNFGSANVSKLLASTGATVGTYAVGNNPQGICFDGTNIWVVNSASGTLTKLLASTGAVVGTYTVGGTPREICFDGTYVWVTDIHNLIQVLASTGAVVGTFTISGASLLLGIAFDGTNLWCADTSGKAFKVLASSGALQATVSTGTSTSAQYVAFDGINIWVSVATTTTSVALQIDPAGNGIVGRYGASPFGGFAQGVCYDGINSIWVVASGAATQIERFKISPVLDDESYRLLLKAQVFQNHWNGQIDSFQTFWAGLFPGGSLLIDDHQDMTATILLQGGFTSIIQDLIENDLIVPRPQGVLYTFAFPSLPMFGFDENDTFIAGFDIGKFI